MELIRGKNLRQLLNARQNKGFSLSEVVRMGIEAADALNYAHSQSPRPSSTATSSRSIS